ncbi:MAG TPA: hypothetical protein VKA59_25940 [Vicinamibacterales bacterium]|jgi:hypothetical protein|nr:hypothetical protein [Vicinamibacterales bacterium]
MTRVAFAVFGALVLATPSWAQAPADAAVEKALLAAPENMKKDATVVAFKPDFTYDTIKKGTNTMVCLDRSGLPGQQPFSIECTSLGNLPRVAQNLKFEAEPDRTKRQAALDAAEKDGSRIKPEYGSVWIRMQGPDKDKARTHMTVAVPGATTQSTGLPDNPKQGGVWIMNAGTSTAHLMIPGH